MISVDVVHDDVALLELVVAKLSVAFKVEWRRGGGRRIQAKGFIEDIREMIQLLDNFDLNCFVEVGTIVRKFLIREIRLSSFLKLIASLLQRLGLVHKMIQYGLTRIMGSQRAR